MQAKSAAVQQVPYLWEETCDGNHLYTLPVHRNGVAHAMQNECT